VTSRKKGRKPPFEVLFAVWVMMAAIAVFDILGVLAILEVAKEPKPAWVPWLFGFILLLLSVIAASFVQTLKDGDRNHALLLERYRPAVGVWLLLAAVLELAALPGPDCYCWPTLATTGPALLRRSPG
jgi:glucan phosphoethanolaminetransferase (alkaline phosphatase superfamily)